MLVRRIFPLRPGTPHAGRDPKPQELPQSTVNLTNQQLAIIEGCGRAFKVEAVAGSGKTSTLLAYAAARPKRKILYLAYNRSMVREIEARRRQMGLGHVTVSTIHSLAWRGTGGRWTQIESELPESLILDERFVPPRSPEPVLAAWIVKDLVNYYLNSAHITPDDDFLERYCLELRPEPEVEETLRQDPVGFSIALRRLLSAMREGEIPIVHDFYLKLFQLQKPWLNYDIILVDEAQDASPVMLDIVLRQDATRIFVGDSFQQIYAFRHAVNALRRLNLPSLPLTLSFRFGQALASRVQKRTNRAYRLLGAPGEAVLRIRGADAWVDFGWRRLQHRRPLTIICRSNLGVFNAALSWVSKAARLYFEGGLPRYSFMNDRVASAIHLAKARREKITDPLIARFDSLGDLERFARETRNGHLANIASLARNHGDKTFFLYKRIQEKCTSDPAHADVILTNVHQAKGREYNHVIMNDDFVTLDDLKVLRDAQPRPMLREEANLYYVAATRAKKGIHLAPD